MSRTKSAIKNIIASGSNQLIMIICGLILPRLIINTYGSEVNGLVSTVKQILNYFSIVSLGLGAASSVALYKPLKERDFERVSSIMSATRVFFNKTGYIFSFLIAVTSFILPMIVNGDISKSTISLIVLICGIGTICEYIFIDKYKILLIADQKAFVQSNYQAQGFLINTTLSVILIKLNLSIVFIQIASTLTYIIRLIMLKKYIKNNYPKININVEPDMGSINNRWEAFLFQISDLIIVYTPIILIALFCGFKEASIYSVYNMIFSSIATLVGVFSFGLTGGFGNVLAENNEEVTRKTYKGFDFIFRIITFTCYSCALILIIPFINIYINTNDGVNYLVPQIAILFACSGLSKSIRTPSFTIVQAAGKFKENIKLNLIEAFTNFILALILVDKFGIIGILLASFITGLIRSILYIKYVSDNIIKVKYFKNLSTLALNTLNMYFLYTIINNITCHNFIEFFIKASIITIICSMSYLIVNILFDYHGFKIIYEKIKNMVELKISKNLLIINTYKDKNV